MANVQVTCVTKQTHPDPHQGITYLGGANWYWSRQQVIESIEGGTNTFFTQVGGKTAYLAVVNGQYGKYLRTHADGAWNDNLLALPACPAR